MIQRAFEICLCVMLAEIVLLIIIVFTITLLYNTYHILAFILRKLWNEKKE